MRGRAASAFRLLSIVWAAWLALSVARMALNTYFVRRLWSGEGDGLMRLWRIADQAFGVAHLLPALGMGAALLMLARLGDRRRPLVLGALGALAVNVVMATLLLVMPEAREVGWFGATPGSRWCSAKTSRSRWC